jgi:hypothetical protein
MTVSVLMPAKNASAFVEAAVLSAAAACGRDWELIIVDDHSTDPTAAICRELARRWTCVKVLPNEGEGKIRALNLAFRASAGGLVTTLDADDCLLPAFARSLAGGGTEWTAMCRDYQVTDSRLRPVGVYHAGRRFFTWDFPAVLSGLVSLPRGCWTMTRDLAEKVFPIPEDLPFEDVWFSLVIKRFAAPIAHVRKPLYAYRQHAGQTYGGVLNHSPEVTMFRARRLARYAAVLPAYAGRLQTRIGSSLDGTRLYFETLARRGMSVGALLRAPLSIGQKASIFAFRRLWPLLSAAKRIQWAVSGLGR